MICCAELCGDTDAKRVGGAVDVGPLASRDRSVEEMRWEILGYARGFACSAAMDRLRFWEGVAKKRRRMDMSHHGVVPGIPEQLGFGDVGPYREEANAMYTLAMKVLDSHPMLTMFHTSPLCGGLNIADGSDIASVRWNFGHVSGAFDW